MRLRQLPDDQRAVATRELALDIRKLRPGPAKLDLASGLANLATEGDFGRDTLQQVTTTLEGALREMSLTRALPSHIQLAQLVRYEGMKADLSAPVFAEVVKELEANDAARQSAAFTVTDLKGKQWDRAGLKGKVVLLNFWATWCPPCRKEMPDLDALQKRFASKGLVVLAISDEEAEKVKGFLADKPYTFAVALDPGRKANDAFRVQGIPKSFVFDREGRLVAQSIDMRTQEQFLAMLAKAGLQ